MPLSWVEAKEVCSYIKHHLLDTEVLKPLPYLDHSRALAEKKNNHGDIEDEVWYCLVKRAAAEWLEERPLDNDNEYDSPLTSTEKSPLEQLKTPPPPAAIKTPAKSFTQGQKKIDSEQHIPEKMTARSELALPYILSEWEDDRNSGVNRVHVFVHMPSGTEGEGTMWKAKVDGQFLQFSIRWPPAMTSPDTMFGHSRFLNKFYHTGNAIVGTMKKSINKLAGGKEFIESDVKIPLPEGTGPFEPTPDEHSGHCWIEPLIREHPRITAKSSVIFMFDLQRVSENTAKSFTERKVAEEDFDYF